MRNIDEINFHDANRKKNPVSYRIQKLGTKILRLKKQGKDFSNYKDFKELGFTFNEYVEALAHLDEIEEHIIHESQKTKYLKKLDPVPSSTYKIPNIYRIIMKINESENREQTFYDELLLPFFRNYVELILSDTKLNIKLKEYNIKDEDKEIYFKRPYEFVEIIKHPLLSKKQKNKMINDTYNTCKTIKYSSFMIENMIKKENLIKIDLDTQRFILEKFIEIHEHRQLRKMSKLGVYYG